jgi:hypothetical protein
VSDQLGYADRPPGYVFVTLGAAEVKPYGDQMRGFAIVGDEVDASAPPKTTTPTPPTTVADSPKAILGECGSIRDPATDAFHGVEVSGTVSCDEAGSTLNRYTMDSGLAKHGDAQTARFNGWTCETSSDGLAEFVMRCTRGQDVIQAR